MTKKPPSNDQSAVVRKRTLKILSAPMPDADIEMAGWIVTSIDEAIQGKNKKESIRLAGQALRGEDTEDGSSLLEDTKIDRRTSLIQLLDRWPVERDDKNPDALADLLGAMWHLEDSPEEEEVARTKGIVCMAIRGNCKQERFWGRQEEKASRDFMQVALDLAIQWQSETDIQLNDLPKNPLDIKKIKTVSKALRPTIAALKKGLGIMEEPLHQPDISSRNTIKDEKHENRHELSGEVFEAILTKKIAEAVKNPEFIYQSVNPLILSTGVVHFNGQSNGGSGGSGQCDDADQAHPRFEKFSEEDKIRYDGSPNEWGNEPKIRAYFKDNPEESLADYLRGWHGVGSPEDEAMRMVSSALDTRQAQAMLDVNRGRTSWVEHWGLRGPDHLYATFKCAYKLNAGRFMELCEQSVEVIATLKKKPTEKAALKHIQGEMLKVAKEYHGETMGIDRRWSETAIQTLEGSLGKLEDVAAAPAPETKKRNGLTPKQAKKHVKDAGGNVSEAARCSGYSRTTLYKALGRSHTKAK